MVCLYRAVLPPASGTCNRVLSALHSHLRRASTAFCTCECNMVTHYQRLRKSAPSVAHTGDRATWYLTDTQTHSRAVSYHEAICHTHAGIYTYMELYMFPPHPSPVLPVTCTAPYWSVLNKTWISVCSPLHFLLHREASFSLSPFIIYLVQIIVPFHTFQSLMPSRHLLSSAFSHTAPLPCTSHTHAQCHPLTCDINTVSAPTGNTKRRPTAGSDSRSPLQVLPCVSPRLCEVDTALQTPTAAPWGLHYLTQAACSS